MNLLRFDKVCLEFGDTPLLRNAEFAISSGERVCLIGRNGAGKSSLLRLLTNAYQPDSGRVERRPELSISELAQELVEGSDKTVREVIAEGLAEQFGLIQQFEQLSASTHMDVAQLERIQHRIEAHGGWQVEQQVDSIITRLQLPATRSMRVLSGGWRRRVALARALVSRPDLLLLDEPTNHLDISTIEWLENEARTFPGAILFISHDRAFMQRLATRIVELDLGVLTSWEGDYAGFLRHKEQMLADEARHQALFDKRLAQEETWIRQGIQARRTRNEGRVRALQAMRRERAGRLERPGRATVEITQGGESGRKVIEARDVGHAFDGRVLFENFSTTVLRGDRVGLIGNNGVGKSTLLRILLGQLSADRGVVKLGSRVALAYSDQLRDTLDFDQTIAENVGGGQDFVTINGRQKHVISYLEDFLFSGRRARTPVKALSGGERHRVILARLFAQPANLLVLDEPTNDLDVEMLEVLEARLADYEGTLLLVSHDREFLDNVVTNVLVFEDDGKIHEYVGGYREWLARDRQLAIVDRAAPPKTRTAVIAKPVPSRKKKLSYKLQRELAELPDRIDALERRVAELSAEVARPELYRDQRTGLDRRLQELAGAQQALDEAMDRWAKLEVE